MSQRLSPASSGSPVGTRAVTLLVTLGGVAITTMLLSQRAYYAFPQLRAFRLLAMLSCRQRSSPCAYFRAAKRLLLVRSCFSCSSGRLVEMISKS